MDSRYSRFGKNTILVVVGNIGSKFMAFLMLPFYTRWLPVDEYGIVDVIGIYVSFLIGIVTCAIAEAVFVFPKGAKQEKQAEYFSSGINFIILMFLLLTLVFGAIDFICTKFCISNTFTENIWLILGILTTTSVQQYIQQFTRSIDRITVYSVSGVILTLSSIIFSFLLIPSYGVIGYVSATMIGNVIASIYSLVFSHSYRYYSYSAASVKSCKKMLKYSTPLVPNNVMWWIVSALNRPVMETFLGLEAIGLFAVANKFPAVISSAFSMFAISWQISVLEEFGKDGYSKFFNKVFRWVVFLMVILGCVITVFSYKIIEVFADSRYIESWRYIPVLTLSTVFLAISGFAGSNFSATKESKYFFYSSVWGALTAIIANMILIPTIGTMGACLSVVLSFLVMSFSRCYYCWKYVKIENLLRVVMTVFLNICVIGATLYPFGLILKLLMYSICFISILLCNYDIIRDPVKIIKNRLK